MSPFSQLRSLIDLAVEQRTTSVQPQSGSSSKRGETPSGASIEQETEASRAAGPARNVKPVEEEADFPVSNPFDEERLNRLRRIIQLGDTRALLAALGTGEIDLSQKLENGETLGVRLLFYAVSSGHQTVTRTLLLHGVDPREPNAEGDSAFDVADFMHKQDICNIILRHEVEVRSAAKSPCRKAVTITNKPSGGDAVSATPGPATAQLREESSPKTAPKATVSEPPSACGNALKDAQAASPGTTTPREDAHAGPINGLSPTPDATPETPSETRTYGSRRNLEFDKLSPDVGLTVDLNSEDEDDLLDAFFGSGAPSLSASSASGAEAHPSPRPEVEAGPKQEAAAPPTKAESAAFNEDADSAPAGFAPVSVRMPGGFVPDHDSLERWRLRETDAVTRLRCMERLSLLPLEDRLILAFIRIQNRQPIDLDLGIHCGELFRMLKLYGDELIAAMEAEGSEE